MNNTHLKSQNHNTTIQTFALMTVILLPAVIHAEDAREICNRFVDVERGYSIVPPSGSEVGVSNMNTTIARWVKQNDTGANDWALRLMEADCKVPTHAVIKERVTRRGGIVDAIKSIRIADRPAFLVTGRITMPVSKDASGKEIVALLGFNEAWTTLPKGKTLIISLHTGEDVPKKNVNAIWEEAIGSIRWIDIKKDSRRREKAAKAAFHLIHGNQKKSTPSQLTIKTISSVIPIEPRWYTIQNEHRELTGWLCWIGGKTRKGGKEGIQLNIWSMRQSVASNKPVMTLYSAFLPNKTEMAFQRWDQIAQIGEGEGAHLINITGAQEGDSIMVTASINGKHKRPIQVFIPDVFKKVYIPYLTSAILPNLLKLSQVDSNEFTFAIHKSESTSFDMRTITADKTETVRTFDGDAIQATRYIDRAGMASQATIHWVDDRGRTIQTLRPGGELTRLTSRDTLLKQYPKAEAIIRQMSKVFKEYQLLQQGMKKKTGSR